MWSVDLVPGEDPLRQGDLLSGLPFPRRGTLTLTVDQMRADVYASRNAVVLDQCCTVEQENTVLLGRVGEVRRLPPEHRLAQALAADVPEEGRPYSKYFHLLEPTDGVLQNKANKVWVIELTERVSIGVKAAADLVWLQEHRVRRMTPLARARLRTRLGFHFMMMAEEDQAELEALGLDEFGRPVA